MKPNKISLAIARLFFSTSCLPRQDTITNYIEKERITIQRFFVKKTTLGIKPPASSRIIYP